MDKSKIEHLNPQEYTHLPHADQKFEDHEQTDVAIRPLIWTLIAIALTIVVSAVGMWGLFEVFQTYFEAQQENQAQSNVEVNERLVPEGSPDLQGPVVRLDNVTGIPTARQLDDLRERSNSPAQDMDEMREHNRKILDGREPMRTSLQQAGLPIEVAMDKALASGMFKHESAATQPARSSAASDPAPAAAEQPK
jgi:hypothetical protein